MWILKLQLKHNCIIANRCKKFQCTSMGYPLDFYKEKSSTYYLHFEKIDGKVKDIKAFIQDLKKDKNITKFENNGNTIFFVYKEKRKEKMPGQLSLASKKVFHTKPVFVDRSGVEHWEVCSWSRKDINQFIRFIKQKTEGLQEFKIIKIAKIKVNELFFPKLLPNLTQNQKRALKIAIEKGYYTFPREIELRNLAEMMDISLSTYREHLRKAERKIIPQLQDKIASV